MSDYKKGIIDTFKESFSFGMINIKALKSLFDAERVSKVKNILKNAGITIIQVGGEEFVTCEELAQLFATAFGKAGYRGSYYPQFINLPKGKKPLILKINGLRKLEVDGLIESVKHNPEEHNIDLNRKMIDVLCEKSFHPKGDY